MERQSVNSQIDEYLWLYSLSNVYVEYDDGLTVCHDKDGTLSAWYGGETRLSPEDAEEMGLVGMSASWYSPMEERADMTIWVPFPAESIDYDEKGNAVLDLSFLFSEMDDEPYFMTTEG